MPTKQTIRIDAHLGITRQRAGANANAPPLAGFNNGTQLLFCGQQHGRTDRRQGIGATAEQIALAPPGCLRSVPTGFRLILRNGYGKSIRPKS